MIKRMRDYPRELWIGDNQWFVRFVRQCGASGAFENLGLCDPSIHTIFIKFGQTPAERFQTFIHEIFHAIEFEHDLQIPHELISALEVPIASLLSENGLVF